MKLLLFASLAAVSILVSPANAQSVDELFDPQTLQEIRLFVNSRDLTTLRERFEENTYYAADFEWRGNRVRNAAIRSRGVASRSGVKPALRVDFDRYVTGQRFLGLRSIILKNLWQDPSMIRERLAMSLFVRLGEPASRESFCRLFINNEYQGLYTIVEAVDTSFLARTLNEDTGYLFTYQFTQPFHGEDLGDDLSVYAPLFEAQTHQRETDRQLYGPIRDLLREVNQPDDNVWRERVEQYVDLGQLMTQAAIENFLVEEDGLLGMHGMNNFYFYRFAGTNRHRFIVWDKDSAFANVDQPVLSRVDENVLFRRAFAYSDLRARYFDVLENASRTVMEDGWLESEVQRAVDLIAAAVEEDTRKPFTTEQFHESIAFLKFFARERPRLVLDDVARARLAR